MVSLSRTALGFALAAVILGNSIAFIINQPWNGADVDLPNDYPSLNLNTDVMRSVFNFGQAGSSDERDAYTGYIIQIQRWINGWFSGSSGRWQGSQGEIDGLNNRINNFLRSDDSTSACSARVLKVERKNKEEIDAVQRSDYLEQVAQEWRAQYC